MIDNIGNTSSYFHWQVLHFFSDRSVGSAPRSRLLDKNYWNSSETVERSGTRMKLTVLSELGKCLRIWVTSVELNKFWNFNIIFEHYFNNYSWILNIVLITLFLNKHYICRRWNGLARIKSSTQSPMSFLKDQSFLVVKNKSLNSCVG